MTLAENRYAVFLYSERAGTLHQRGDHTRFVFTEEYLANRERAILGLQLEENLSGRHVAALRLPPWFSNLLPEGRLRDWIADDRGVSIDREMELLAQVGHDLPAGRSGSFHATTRTRLCSTGVSAMSRREGHTRPPPFRRCGSRWPASR